MSRTFRKPRTEKQRKELLGRLAQDHLHRAEGGQDDAVQSNRAQALAYYNGSPRGDELEHRSQVVSSDVSDMVNATLAMLVPMLSTDCVVEFEPSGEDDEAQAKAESDVVNDVIVEDNNGYLELQEAIKDALLLKNGCMRVDVEDRQSVTYQQLPDEVPTRDHNMIANMVAEQTGGEVEVDESGRLTITSETKRFVVSARPIENISYSAGYVGDLNDLPFFAERVLYTRSQLVEMGVDKKEAYELPAMSEAQPAAHTQRNQGTDQNEWNSLARDQDNIECHLAYIRVDMDGDGISELYSCLIADQSTCLEYEAVDLIPYALGSPFLQPHRLTGESLFDHLKATQDVKTAYHRQLIDNVTLLNNGKYVYDPARVTETDVMQPITVGGIRARDTTAITPLMIPDVTTGILAALQYEDAKRSERGGASLDLLSADAQLVGETAHGIERQYGSREALASMMARNLAETMIRRIYKLTHEYLRRYAVEPYSVRVNGQTTETDPRSWQPRDRLNVKVGMSPGERSHLQNVLFQHIQLGVTAMQQGMTDQLANASTVYRTAMEWLRMAGYDNPERLAINPVSPQAQQAAQGQQQAARAQAQAAQQREARVFDLEERKIRNEREAKAADLAHDYYATDMNAEIAEAKLAGEATIEVAKKRMDNEAAAADRSADMGGDT